MKKITSLKIGQQISFDSEDGVKQGTIIELYRYPQDDEGQNYSYNIVAEVAGEEINYNLSVENILENVQV